MSTLQILLVLFAVQAVAFYFAVAICRAAKDEDLRDGTDDSAAPAKNGYPISGSLA
jgi:hypothetical protein